MEDGNVLPIVSMERRNHKADDIGWWQPVVSLGFVFRPAAVARPGLFPDVAELLDPGALVIGVVSGAVAVGLEPLLGAATAEDELLVVTHVCCKERDVKRADGMYRTSWRG